MTVRSITCPECEWEFSVEDPVEGEVLVCDDCSLNLIVEDVDVRSGRVRVALTQTDADDWGQ